MHPTYSQTILSVHGTGAGIFVLGVQMSTAIYKTYFYKNPYLELPLEYLIATCDCAFLQIIEFC
jgi:hypothetical protein